MEDRPYPTDGDPVDSVVHVVDSPEDGAATSGAATSNQTKTDSPAGATAEPVADAQPEPDVTSRPNSAKNSDMANISDAPTTVPDQSGTESAPEPPVSEPPISEPAISEPPVTEASVPEVAPELGAAVSDPAAEPAATTVEEPPTAYAEEWRTPSDWHTGGTPREAPSDDLTPHAAQLVPPVTGHHPEEPGEYEYEYDDEYDDVAVFGAIFSAPSLALAAFVFALTGLLGGMIPNSLPYLVQIDPSTGPAHLIRIVGWIAMGFAIVAASLGFAAMLRSIGSPLRWPRYLGGAAVLLALLIALQSVTLIALAAFATKGG
jgi:hypothetical protein